MLKKGFEETLNSYGELFDQKSYKEKEGSLDHIFHESKIL